MPYSSADLETYIAECAHIWEEIQSISSAPNTLTELDSATSSVIGEDIFNEYFTGVDYKPALIAVFKHRQVDINGLREIKRNLVKVKQQIDGSCSIHEAAKRKLLREKVLEYFEQYVKNEIFEFSALKAKILVECFGHGSKLADKVRFTHDEESLKEVFGIKNKKKEILKEAEDSVEQMDNVAFFSDLATIEGSLSEAMSLMYQYKNQYTADPSISSAIQKIQHGLASVLDKVNETLIIVGTKGNR